MVALNIIYVIIESLLLVNIMRIQVDSVLVVHFWRLVCCKPLKECKTDIISNIPRNGEAMM